MTIKGTLPYHLPTLPFAQEYFAEHRTISIPTCEQSPDTAMAVATDSHRVPLSPNILSGNMSDKAK